MNDIDSQIDVDEPILPDLLDVSTAGAVKQSLLERRGANLTLDGSAVRKASAVGLQVVISAIRTWQADGHQFHIHEPSDAMRDAFAQMGFDASAVFENAGGIQ